MNPKDNKKSYTPGKKVFDVSRPGKTPAQPGARPVITNRDTVDDPDISSKRSLLNPKQKITITPADNDSKEQKPAAKPQPKEPTGPPPVDQDSSAIDVSVTKEFQDEPEPKPAQAQPPKVDIAEQEKPIGRMESTAYEEPPRGSSPDELAAEKPTEPIHRERVEPMHMGMPQEFNPSGAIVSQHAKHRTLWLEILSVLIILILLAAIANLLLDAEIIKTDLNIPHTDFFKPI